MMHSAYSKIGLKTIITQTCFQNNKLYSNTVIQKKQAKIKTIISQIYYKQGTCDLEQITII